MNDMNNTISTVDVGADVYRYILSSLTPGTSYEFMIAAFNSHAEGPTTDPPLPATTKSSGRVTFGHLFFELCSQWYFVDQFGANFLILAVE